MALVRAGDTGIDMVQASIGPFSFLTPTERTSTVLTGDFRTEGRRDLVLRLKGTNLPDTISSPSGTVNRVVETVNGALLFEVTGIALAMATAVSISTALNYPSVQAEVFSGADRIQGGAGNDVLKAFGGNNTINGGGGNDTAVYDVNSTTAPSYRFRDEAAIFRTGGRQADLLIGVENVRFTNTTVPQVSLTAAQPFQYTASYADLTTRFGTDEVAAWRHFAQTGLVEGRTVSFSGLRYIASYADLRATYGTNAEAGARHYLASGRTEGRTANFDGLRYIASNPDLIRVLPKTVDAGTMHFIAFGANEGRPTIAFDPLRYIASYRDLTRAFGTNEARGTEHYLASGFTEGRSATAFNPNQYLANYADVRAAFGTDTRAATLHFIQYGAAENRVFTPLA